jgi:hypothetical protein
LLVNKEPAVTRTRHLAVGTGKKGTELLKYPSGLEPTLPAYVPDLSHFLF